MSYFPVIRTQRTAETTDSLPVPNPQRRSAPVSTLSSDRIETDVLSFADLQQAQKLYGMQRPPASDVASMSMSERVAVTTQSGLASAAADTASAVGAWIKAHPGQTAGIGLAADAIVGAQVIPGVDVGVDAALGTVGAVMYAAAGAEHRANITRALGRLQDYAEDVSTAKTPDDLQRASADFADFVKIGGKETIDALGVVGGAAAGATKVAGLASKIKAAGGLDAVIAAGSPGLDALGNAANSAFESVNRGIDEVGHWLDHHFPGAPGLQPAIAGAPNSATAALGDADKAGSVLFSKRYTLAGEEGPGKLHGHTLERHVGQTEADLRNRLRREPGLPEDSTFSSEAIANRVVGKALKYQLNPQKIQAWLADTGSAPSR